MVSSEWREIKIRARNRNKSYDFSSDVTLASTSPWYGARSGDRARTMGKRCSHGSEKHLCAVCNPCPHGKVKHDCVKCSPCPQGKLKRNCVDCNACPHGKVKKNCLQCNPCPKKKLKRNCADCTPCPHGKVKSDCAACKSVQGPHVQGPLAGLLAGLLVLHGRSHRKSN